MSTQEKRVLIIEDDLDIRAGMVHALEDEGYKTWQAGHGREGLELLRSLPKSQLPHCIILDLMMPEVDGMKFLENLEKEKNEDFGRIPIIVATAKGATRIPVHMPGVTERILKPIDLEDLYERVGRCCGSASAIH